VEVKLRQTQKKGFKKKSGEKKTKMSTDECQSTRVFYQLDEFPQLKSLRDAWPQIRAELDALPSTTLDLDRRQSTWGAGAVEFVRRLSETPGWIYSWQARRAGEPESRNELWLNWGLVFEDQPIGCNAALCPFTTALLRSMRGIHAAGFSLLKPGAEIFPHTDTTGAEFGNLAFHLGLDVPDACEGECALEVFDSRGELQRAVEKNGDVVIFDACHTHQAFNRTAKARTILYIDFEMADAAQVTAQSSSPDQ
jgi:aspartyl/asparaginyl beta-hydroxylase (cupin superfamily)